MTDSAEKLLREARDFVITGLCPLPDGSTFNQQWQDERTKLIDAITAHLSAHPVTGEGDANALTVDDCISLWSMRPQPGTPNGKAWEDGARRGWEWAVRQGIAPAAPMTAASGMDEGEG